jgi:nitrite reductase/ring-hydroxylating ferredoxin subunit
MTSSVSAGTELMRLSDLPDGATRGFVLGGDDWAPSGFLVRVGSEVHAYLNRCPHALRPLNFMPDRFLAPDGGLIQCTAHGALFEKDTGLCIAGPCLDESLRRIAVRVVDGRIRLDEELDLAKLERWPR